MKRELAISLIILLLAPQVIAIAQTNPGAGSGSYSNFISDLQATLPGILLLLAILANRYDQRYALVLFASALATAMFLGLASKTGLNLNAFFAGNVTTVQLEIEGTEYVTVNQLGTWVITNAPKYIPSNEIHWYIMNISNGVKVESGNGTFITWVPNSPGRYIIVATFTYSNSTSMVYGYGSYIFNSQYPPSPLGWITEAIDTAIKTVISSMVEGFSFLGQFVPPIIVPTDELIYSPVPNTLANEIYSKIEFFTTGIAMLFIAFSIAYNAIRGFYADLVDLASDVFYKLGVWALFTGVGLTIYSISAGFLNFLINQTVGTYINAVTGEMFTSIATYTALFIASNFIPLGFASTIKGLLDDVMFFYLVFQGLALVRYSVLLAAVSLIPLASTLWIFEWTRKISNVIVDLIVGLMLSGLISAVTLAFLQQNVLGILFFLLAPIVGGIDLAVSLFFTFTSLRPHEQLAGALRNLANNAPSLPPSSQNPQSPPSPPPSTPQSPPSQSPQQQRQYYM